MKLQVNDTRIHHVLERAAFKENTWAALRAEGHTVEDAGPGKVRVSQAVYRALKGLNAALEPRRGLRAGRRTGRRDWRERARVQADLDAAEASRDAAVAAWRKTALGGRLRTTAARAARWLEAQAGRHGAPGSQRGRRMLIPYAGPDGWARRVPANTAVLRGLHAASEGLVDRYGWTLDQAVMFILTGLPPIVPPLRGEDVHANYGSERPRAAIVITAAPWVPVAEVAAVFRRLQARVTPAGSCGETGRRMTTKQLALAASLGTSAGTWRERLARWNKTHRGWSYREDVQRFHRDSTRAQRRLCSR